MKTTQILYLLIFVGIIVWIVRGKHLDEEGFETLLPVNSESEPTIAKGLEPTRLSVKAMPNSSTPGTLPFGPYGQMASVGSYQYQDPAKLPSTLEQMKQLYEDIRRFLVFEGATVASSSDPTVQLPLTQLRADNKRLEQEISVLKSNPGIQSSLTQENVTDIEGALTFLQRRVRLFQTSGLLSSSSSNKMEGFENPSRGKTRATQDDLLLLQAKLYAAILSLSTSGTIDPIVQARIKKLQDMYTTITDMINKLNNGVWKPTDVPVFQEDINSILPSLDKTDTIIKDIFQPTNGSSSSIQDTLIGIFGKDGAKSLASNFKNNGSLRVNVELGYNANLSKSKSNSNSNSSNDRIVYSKDMDLVSDTDGSSSSSSMKMDQAFDTTMSGAEENNSKLGGLDWKNRAASICEQVRLRGLDPQDFGCMAPDSIMSPAYSWRGYAKMVCGRLGATMDPNLPVVCGCPPQGWKGWNTF